MRSRRSGKSIQARCVAHPAPVARRAVPAPAAGTLPRRQPGARLPGEAYRAAPTHTAPDEALLARLRTGLHALR